MSDLRHLRQDVILSSSNTVVQGKSESRGNSRAEAAKCYLPVKTFFQLMNYNLNNHPLQLCFHFYFYLLFSYLLFAFPFILIHQGH